MIYKLNIKGFLVLALAVSANSWAQTGKIALNGALTLDIPGKSFAFRLGRTHCRIEVNGDVPEDEQPHQRFMLILQCNKKRQVLWDLRHPFKDDPKLKNPKFAVLWAGDRDFDGKIDFEMELSPSDHCNRNVLFLSSKAKKNEIVGLEKLTQIACSQSSSSK